MTSHLRPVLAQPPLDAAAAAAGAASSRLRGRLPRLATAHAAATGGGFRASAHAAAELLRRNNNAPGNSSVILSWERSSGFPRFFLGSVCFSLACCAGAAGATAALAAAVAAGERRPGAALNLWGAMRGARPWAVWLGATAVSYVALSFTTVRAQNSRRRSY